MANRKIADEKYKPYGGIPVFACSASDICEDCMRRFYEREAEREAEAKANEEREKTYSKAFSLFLENHRQQIGNGQPLEKNPRVDMALEGATTAWKSMSDTEKNTWVDRLGLVGDKTAQEGTDEKAKRS